TWLGELWGSSRSPAVPSGGLRACPLFHDRCRKIPRPRVVGQRGVRRDRRASTRAEPGCVGSHGIPFGGTRRANRRPEGPYSLGLVRRGREVIRGSRTETPAALSGQAR